MKKIYTSGSDDSVFISTCMSQENLEDWYFNRDKAKLEALYFAESRIRQNHYKNILSLGAGSCVLEDLLARENKITMVATDINPVFIKKAQELFTVITVVPFDLLTSDVATLQKELNIKFDCAVFFGSSYVMDKYRFKELFCQLKDAGIKEIIDFQSAFLSRHFIYYIYDAIYRLVFRIGRQGKFHGHARAKGEFRKLYKQVGLKIISESKVAPYEYVAILQS